MPQYCRTVYRGYKGTDGRILKIIEEVMISVPIEDSGTAFRKMRRDPLTHLYNKVATGEEVERDIK